MFFFSNKVFSKVFSDLSKNFFNVFSYNFCLFFFAYLFFFFQKVSTKVFFVILYTCFDKFSLDQTITGFIPLWKIFGNNIVLYFYLQQR